MSNITVFEYNSQSIQQRTTDGYVNATQMCQANGKLIADWLRTEDYKRYTEAISRSMGIPIDRLVVIIKTGKNENRGTWIHPKLAIKLARWISVEFELWCDDHIKTLIETGSTKLSPRDSEWTQTRVEGKRIRYKLTDAIKAYLERHPDLPENKKKYLYANASDTLNVNLLGKTSKELKSLLGLSNSQLLRANTASCSEGYWGLHLLFKSRVGEYISYPHNSEFRIALIT